MPVSDKTPGAVPPLWLPVGSVRAILTIGVVFGTCMAYVLGHGDLLPQYWDTVFLGVLGAYFGTRFGEGKK